MLKNKYIYMLIVVLLGRSSLAYAGRPLATDDADPTGKGEIEVELGADYTKFDSCRHWDFPIGVAYGLNSATELGVGFGFQSDKEKGASELSGIMDVTLGLKWKYCNENSWMPRQALVPAVKIPTADEEKGLGSGEFDYDVIWIASKSIGEKVGIHVNAGYSVVGSPEGEKLSDVILAGLAGDYQLLESFQLVAELFAEKNTSGDANAIICYKVGCRWAAAEIATVDVAYGGKVSGDYPDEMVSVGMTLLLGSK